MLKWQLIYTTNQRICYIENTRTISILICLMVFHLNQFDILRCSTCLVSAVKLLTQAATSGVSLLSLYFRSCETITCCNSSLSFADYSMLDRYLRKIQINSMLVITFIDFKLDTTQQELSIFLILNPSSIDSKLSFS